MRFGLSELSLIPSPPLFLSPANAESHSSLWVRPPPLTHLPAPSLPATDIYFITSHSASCLQVIIPLYLMVDSYSVIARTLRSFSEGAPSTAIYPPVQDGKKRK